MNTPPASSQAQLEQERQSQDGGGAVPAAELAGAAYLGAAARGLGVMYGPSIVLDLLVAGCLFAFVRGPLTRQPTTWVAHLLRPLVAIGAAAPAAYLLAIRPWLRRWGATDDEVRMSLPGDDLVPDPAIAATWAVTVHAPATDVWGWLAQVGQDRGGFYSYEALENLAGCQMHNADRIHPEWQHREIGELVMLAPVMGLKVAHFEPNRALVLEGWGSFTLEPIDEQRTRLISRSQLPHGWMAWSYALLLEIPHFVMQRKMLLGIKERAEAARASA
jgi:hypothetical protein